MSGRLRFEGYTLPTTGTWTKKFFSIPAAPGAAGRRELSGWNDCSMPVSAEWEGLTDLLTGTLIRVLDGDTWVDDFVAERTPRHLRIGGTVTVTGRQVAGLTADIPVYPPDYGTNPSQRPNWIWAGKNVAGPIELTDLGHIREEWTLYLSGERYELDTSLATTGTYTLTVGGNTTAAIAFDALGPAIKSALEALTGVTEVSVLQADSDTREFTVVFENPKDLASDMTADFTGTGGLGTLTKQNDGFDTSTNPTFTVTVDAQTTEALAWNISAQSLEGTSETLGDTGLQGLSTVDDVRVSGAGIASDPWVVVFFDPPTIGAVSVTFAAGTAVLTNTVDGRLDPSPITQSQSPDERVDPLIHGEYDDPAIEVVTDAGLQDGDTDWVLRVNATGQFAGSQLILRVDPGETYQASIRIKPTVTGGYTLVIRDMAENLIAQSASQEFTANTWAAITIADVVIPAGIDQVIMRVAVSAPEPDRWADFYVNWQDAQFVTGLAAATPGDIVGTILAHAQDQSDGAWLDLTADATNDTGATAWPSTFSYQADGFAMNLSDVLNDMRDRFGAEWSVTPKATPAAGVTHELNMWVTDGAGTDRTATGPALWVSGSIVDGEIVDRIPRFTRLVGWGAADLYVADTNTSTSAVYGTITRVLDVEELADSASIQEALDTAFADEEDDRKAGKVMIEGGSVIPFVDFDLGDTLVCQAPPALSKTTRRVLSVSWQHGSPVARYEVDV